MSIAFDKFPATFDDFGGGQTLGGHCLTANLVDSKSY